MNHRKRSNEVFPGHLPMSASDSKKFKDLENVFSELLINESESVSFSSCGNDLNPFSITTCPNIHTTEDENQLEYHFGISKCNQFTFKMETNDNFEENQSERRMMHISPEIKRDIILPPILPPQILSSM